MSIYRLVDADGKVEFCPAVRAYRIVHVKPEPGLTLQWFDHRPDPVTKKGAWREYTEPSIFMQSAPLRAAAPKWSASDFASPREKE